MVDVDPIGWSFKWRMCDAQPRLAGLRADQAGNRPAAASVPDVDPISLYHAANVATMGLAGRYLGSRKCSSRNGMLVQHFIAAHDMLLYSLQVLALVQHLGRSAEFAGVLPSRDGSVMVALTPSALQPGGSRQVRDGLFLLFPYLQDRQPRNRSSPHSRATGIAVDDGEEARTFAWTRAASRGGNSFR